MREILSMSNSSAPGRTEQVQAEQLIERLEAAQRHLQRYRPFRALQELQGQLAEFLSDEGIRDNQFALLQEYDSVLSDLIARNQQPIEERARRLEELIYTIRNYGFEWAEQHEVNELLVPYEIQYPHDTLTVLARYGDALRRILTTGSVQGVIAQPATYSFNPEMVPSSQDRYLAEEIPRRLTGSGPSDPAQLSAASHADDSDGQRLQSAVRRLTRYVAPSRQAQAASRLRRRRSPAADDEDEDYEDTQFKRRSKRVKKSSPTTTSTEPRAYPQDIGSIVPPYPIPASVLGPSYQHGTVQQPGRSLAAAGGSSSLIQAPSNPSLYNFRQYARYPRTGTSTQPANTTRPTAPASVAPQGRQSRTSRAAAQPRTHTFIAVQQPAPQRATNPPAAPQGQPQNQPHNVDNSSASDDIDVRSDQHWNSTYLRNLRSVVREGQNGPYHRLRCHVCGGNASSGNGMYLAGTTGMRKHINDIHRKGLSNKIDGGSVLRLCSHPLTVSELQRLIAGSQGPYPSKRTGYACEPLRFGEAPDRGKPNLLLQEQAAGQVSTPVVTGASSSVQDTTTAASHDSGFTAINTAANVEEQAVEEDAEQDEQDDDSADDEEEAEE